MIRRDFEIRVRYEIRVRNWIHANSGEDSEPGRWGLGRRGCGRGDSGWDKRRRCNGEEARCSSGCYERRSNGSNGSRNKNGDRDHIPSSYYWCE